MARRVPRASVGQRQRAADFGLGPGEQAFQRRVVQAAQDHDLAARQQRAVQREGRIFRRGADQGDGAVLDDRQETVLLRAVEAMDLVDEQQGPLPVRRRRLVASSKARLRSATPENTADNCTNASLARAREQAGDGGLADAGRSPEDQRGERAARQHAGQRALGTEQMVLADDVGERGGPQPVRERAVGVRFGGRRGFGGAEQIIGFWHSGSIAGMRRSGEGGANQRLAYDHSRRMLANVL